MHILFRGVVPTRNPTVFHYSVLFDVGDSKYILFKRVSYYGPIGDPWETHWRPIGDPLETHGRPIGDPCETHGRPMGDPLETHWRPMGDPLETHGTTMGDPLETHGKPMKDPWETHWRPTCLVGDLLKNNLPHLSSFVCVSVSDRPLSEASCFLMSLRWVSDGSPLGL